MKLKEIREMYPEGTQIVLTEMAGERQMPYGLKGTVKFVDDAGQIHMSWENGSSLALNIHEDTFEKVEAPEKISVILVEPGRYPKLIEIEDTLEAMQSLVEGDIEEYIPISFFEGVISGHILFPFPAFIIFNPLDTSDLVCV